MNINELKYKRYIEENKRLLREAKRLIERIPEIEKHCNMSYKDFCNNKLKS